MISLMRKIYNRGPSIDPCGTPCTIGNKLEDTPLRKTYRCLDYKLLLNQSNVMPQIP